MNSLIKNIMGLSSMSDKVIAADFLESAKAGIQYYSIAITEAASPELRATLKSQLNDTIETHRIIMNYMLEKGYYNPYDLLKQLKSDIKATDTVLKLEEKKNNF